MARYSLNEVLKAREAQSGQKKETEEIKLDDVTRVKVLSPTRKVMKRFKKNRLAMFGAYLLLTMFVVSFIGPLFYAWGQTDIFYKNVEQYTGYAMVKKTDRFNDVDLSDTPLDKNNKTVLMMNSYITNTMNPSAEGEPALDDVLVIPDAKILNDEKQPDHEKATYLIRRISDRARIDTAQIYTLCTVDSAEAVARIGLLEPHIAKVNVMPKSTDVRFDENVEIEAGLQKEIKTAAATAMAGATKNSGSFEVQGHTYKFKKQEGTRSYDLYGEPEEGFAYLGEEIGEDFEGAVRAAFEEQKTEVELDEALYVLNYDVKNKYYDVYRVEGVTPVKGYTKLSVHLIKHSGALDSKDLRRAILLAVENGEDTIEVDYLKYHVKMVTESTGEKDDAGNLILEKRPFAIDEEGFTVDAIDNTFEADDGTSLFLTEKDDGTYVIENADGEALLPEKRTYTFVETEEGYDILDEDGEPFARMNDYSVVRYNGEDSLEFDMKEKLIATVKDMGKTTKKLTIDGQIPEQDDSGAAVRENGKIVYKESPMDITREDTGEYIVRCNLVKHLIDRYAPPSRHHLLGTDGDGFDVLSRIMYGGRISLLVGFVVVFLEIFLGIIMGGLAGYYGKWVDMLIMRLVDIFYCLPSMPILIIIGAAMDASRLNPYIRLLVMIASLGVMGWAGVARMVRGQILSLREQEFMVAAEATGIKVRSRIFRHLIPNVMPQLIVIATMGMGGVILTESTLSYLGLGVKHPLATWGSMINSVSTAQAMKYYPYIWIPVGILICLTVIAFNFVGDGLRDAYDPKSNK